MELKNTFRNFLGKEKKKKQFRKKLVKGKGFKNKIGTIRERKWNGKTNSATSRQRFRKKNHSGKFVKAQFRHFFSVPGVAMRFSAWIQLLLKYTRLKWPVAVAVAFKTNFRNRL